MNSRGSRLSHPIRMFLAVMSGTPTSVFGGVFGINHEMRDFVHDRKKNLDMVLCTPSGGGVDAGMAFGDLRRGYEIDLSSAESAAFEELPVLTRTPVGSVLL